MAFRSVGIDLPHAYVDGVPGLAGGLRSLKDVGPDFVEVWPHHLGVVLGGVLDPERLQTVQEVLLEMDLAYTVHAPHDINLMDLTAPNLQRGVLEASLRFAGEIGAEVVLSLIHI